MIEWCCMCKKAEETVDHLLVDYLLVDCEYSKELWSLFFYLFEVQWVMPYTILEVLASWKVRFVRRGNGVLLCLMWHLKGTE